ncbi:MAG: fumarylacetoacetate hydrolase family protein [Gammaproteobacteria bacterium]|nr:fumarylacetoacetate hydrolase family protein [Gammaproteobacteria bacterium]
MSTYLTRHRTADGSRWAADGRYLAEGTDLSALLALPDADLESSVAAARSDDQADGELLAPIDANQEVWAAGVTYLRSREARVEESESKDLYQKVYEAERVEVFFKAIGWRVMGHAQSVRIRRDSRWNVPEPELALVIDHRGRIVGYTAGNDMSSRDIEGENPLYLPQAKIYDGSCALGPGILLARAEALADVAIYMSIWRDGAAVFQGETSTAQLKRSLDEVSGWLTRELAFPNGVLLMTGTGIVPPEDFSLAPGDAVRIEVGELALENVVAR